MSERKLDPILCAVMPRRCGRPAAWERAAGKNGVRGWEPEGVIDPYRKRRAKVGCTRLSAGERFADQLRYSIDDYARGNVEKKAGKPFFTACSDDVTAAAVWHAFRSDPHVYRLWVRPYDGGDLVTPALARAYMAEIDRACGCSLAWAAAIHLKATSGFAKHRHFHVLIRGVIQSGEVLKLRAPFIRNGFRSIMERMLTEKLGPMSDDEIEAMELDLALSAARGERIAGLRRLGFKGWEVQRFEGVAR